jgi:hypothetical protein
MHIIWISNIPCTTLGENVGCLRGHLLSRQCQAPEVSLTACGPEYKEGQSLWTRVQGRTEFVDQSTRKDRACGPEYKEGQSLWTRVQGWTELVDESTRKDRAQGALRDNKKVRNKAMVINVT